MDVAVSHQRNLVVNALSDRQPVQRVTKYGSDVLIESSAVRRAAAFSTACRRRTAYAGAPYKTALQ